MKHIKEKHLILILFALFSHCINAQSEQSESERRKFRAGFGYSFGYSAHADSYFFDQFGSNREFPGLRLYSFNARVGWEFHKRIGIYGIWKFSPSNATVSPYRSRYYGGFLNYYLTDDPRYYVLGGIGQYASKLNSGETTGDGLLVNLGLGVELREHILVELNLLTGEMSHGNVTPDPFVEREINFSVGVGFVF